MLRSEPSIDRPAGQRGIPAIGANVLMPYGGSQWNYGISQRLTTLDETLNRIWRTHQFAFGARIRHEKFGNISNTGANFNAKPNTGSRTAISSSAPRRASARTATLLSIIVR